MTSRPNRRWTLTAPGAATLLGSSILARLPLAMFSIALLVNAQRLTGSFAAAGIVSGAYAIASAAAAPLLGGRVDGYGQTGVLVCGATAAALVLLVNGLLAPGAPALVLVALAGATGLCTPPLAACVRTLLPVIVTDPRRLPELFALESTVLEVTFVAGPPLALGLGSVWSPGAALVLSGLVMLAGTLTFAAQPASRGWRPELRVRRSRGGSLRSPAIRTLVVILLGTGATFGATEVAVTAAAHALGSATAAGPLLGLWGVGLLLGGIAATRLGGTSTSIRALKALLVALALGHGALILTASSVAGLGIVITLAGATIAPTVSTIYAMVDATAPAGTHTEAYSWTLTASLVGAALGSAAAGALGQGAGAASAFAFAAAAGGFAVLASLFRSHSLGSAPADPVQTPLAGSAAAENHEGARRPATDVARQRYGGRESTATWPPPTPPRRKFANTSAPIVQDKRLATDADDGFHPVAARWVFGRHRKQRAPRRRLFGSGSAWLEQSGGHHRSGVQGRG